MSIKCLTCCIETRVIDTRTSRDGKVTRRRRYCPTCGERYTTWERLAASKKPRRSLSARRVELLDFIEDFWEGQGYGPTVRDIKRGLGWSSTSVVYYHINRLEGLGALRRDENKARTLRLA